MVFGKQTRDLFGDAMLVDLFGDAILVDVFGEIPAVQGAVHIHEFRCSFNFSANASIYIYMTEGPREANPPHSEHPL